MSVKDRDDAHGCRNDRHEQHDRHNHYMAMLIIARLLSGHACETPGHMRVTEKHDRTTSNPNAESYHVCLAAESLKSTAATPMSQRIHSGTTRGRKVGNTKHTCGHLCTRASGCRTALLHYGMFDKVALTSPTSSQMLSPLALLRLQCGSHHWPIPQASPVLERLKAVPNLWLIAIVKPSSGCPE